MRYRRIDNKGVLDRPWTVWRVLRASSSTLKFQFTVKCWNMNFLMSSKTKSYQSSREKLRMLRALPSDTPRPPHFQPELWKNGFCEKLDFSRFTNRCLVEFPCPSQRHTGMCCMCCQQTFKTPGHELPKNQIWFSLVIVVMCVVIRYNIVP